MVRSTAANGAATDGTPRPTPFRGVPCGCFVVGFKASFTTSALRATSSFIVGSVVTPSLMGAAFGRGRTCIIVFVGSSVCRDNEGSSRFQLRVGTVNGRKGVSSTVKVIASSHVPISGFLKEPLVDIWCPGSAFHSAITMAGRLIPFVSVLAGCIDLRLA